MASSMSRNLIQISRVGGPEVLEYLQKVPYPYSLEDGIPNQVLVHNKMVGVNFIDTYFRSGVYPLPNLPALLGREAAGIVVAIKNENITRSTGIKVGDRVAYLSQETYTDFAVASTRNLVKLPDSIGFEMAVASLLQGLTALVLSADAYQVKTGDTVLIHAAAGGTGSLLCQLCKLFGATVIGSTSTAEKAQIAKNSGADHVIIYKSENIIDRVNALTHNKGVQAVYDGVGKSTLDISLACLAKRGRLVSFGNASGVIENFQLSKLTKNCLTICRPALAEYVLHRQDFITLANQLFSLIADQKLHINIHKIYPLSETALAHQELESQKTTGKLLLDPTL